MLIANLKKIDCRYLIIIFNVIIGLCALALGKWTAIRLLKTTVDSRPRPKLMMAASDALSARAFAFDYDIATGTLDPVKPKIYRESIEQNLQLILSQYGVVPKRRYSFLLKRDTNINGATPEQNKAYRKLLIEREVATSREQKLATTQKIREVLGNLREESKISIAGKKKRSMQGN